MAGQTIGAKLGSEPKSLIRFPRVNRVSEAKEFLRNVDFR
jgi:hypothetical protein